MKRIISIITAFAIFTAMANISYANSDQIDSETKVFDVETAITYALENSTKTAKTSAEIQRCKSALTEARVQYREYKSNGLSIEEALIDSGYMYEAAQISVNQAERAKATQENAIKTSVKKSFYSCANNKRKIDTARDNLENIKEKNQYAKERYNQGVISQLALKSFELAVVNAQNAYNKAVRDYNLSLIEFKNILNIPLTTDIELKGNFEEKELQYDEIESALEKIKNQDAYLSVQEGKKLTQKRMDIAKGWYSSNEVGYYKEIGVYNSGMSDMADAENQLNLGIITLYSNIKGIEENILYLKEYAQLMKANAEASYTQYELGMITSNDYIETQQKYFESQNTLLDAQLGYYIAVLEYVNMYSGNADM